MPAEQENKMGTMPIRKLLITMSLPMIISMLVQAVSYTHLWDVNPTICE